MSDAHGPAPALETLVSIMNTLDEGVLVEDAHGRALYWNDTFSNFFRGSVTAFREVRGQLAARAADGGAEIVFTNLLGERRSGILRSRWMELGRDKAMVCYFLRDVTEIVSPGAAAPRAPEASGDAEPVKALNPREVVD